MNSKKEISKKSLSTENATKSNLLLRQTQRKKINQESVQDYLKLPSIFEEKIKTPTDFGLPHFEVKKKSLSLTLKTPNDNSVTDTKFEQNNSQKSLVDRWKNYYLSIRSIRLYLQYTKNYCIKAKETIDKYILEELDDQEFSKDKEDLKILLSIKNNIEKDFKRHNISIGEKQNVESHSRNLFSKNYTNIQDCQEHNNTKIKSKMTKKRKIENISKGVEEEKECINISHKDNTKSSLSKSKTKKSISIINEPDIDIDSTLQEDCLTKTKKRKVGKRSKIARTETAELDSDSCQDEDQPKSTRDKVLGDKDKQDNAVGKIKSRAKNAQELEQSLEDCEIDKKSAVKKKEIKISNTTNGNTNRRSNKRTANKLNNIAKMGKTFIDRIRIFQKHYKKLNVVVSRCESNWEELCTDTKNFQNMLLKEGLQQTICDPNFDTKTTLVTNPFQMQFIEKVEESKKRKKRKKPIAPQDKSTNLNALDLKDQEAKVEKNSIDKSNMDIDEDFEDKNNND